MYVVEVWDSETDEIVKVVDAGENRSRAARIERGLQINLNRDLYHTRIRFIKDSSEKNDDTEFAYTE